MESEINTLYNLLSQKQKYQLRKYAINLIYSELEPIENFTLAKNKIFT